MAAKSCAFPTTPLPKFFTTKSLTALPRDLFSLWG
jgi:hypothetical protein